jgi:enterochelin esterase-like enzyme
MGSLPLQLTILSLIVGSLVSGCGNTQDEIRFVHVVESAQAVIAQEGPPLYSLSSRIHPSPDPSTEEITLTEKAAESMKPLGTDRNQCEEVEGRIDRRTYPGMLSGEPIPVVVYLPPCYDPQLQVYPVIFLLHGKPQDEQHWLLLGVDDVVSRGIMDGSLPPLVMVMPYQPEPLFSHSDGGPGSLEQEIMRGLIPFILDRYAVTGEGERWAIAGISRGGVWALEIGFQYPGQFQNVAALSPALNVNYARPSYDPLLQVAEAREIPDRVFLGVGDVDSAREKTNALASTLDDLNIAYRYVEVPGNHDSYTWRALIPDMLSYLTGTW